MSPARREDVYHSVGQRILLAMEHRGIKKKELATILAMSPATIGRWTSGKVRVQVADLERLVPVLGRPVSWFLGEQDENVDQDIEMFASLMSMFDADEKAEIFEQIQLVERRKRRRQS